MTERIPRAVADQVERLFTEESPTVYRRALQAAGRDRGIAEDCVQEAFQEAALAWDKIAGLSPEARRSWLCRVAMRKAIDRYRGTRRLSLTAEIDVAPESLNPEDAALTSMAKDRCLEVIKAMPKARRKVAYLRFHEEWKTSEIAQHLGIAEATVRVHVHAARRALELAVGPEVSFTDAPGENADKEVG
jgi:RNA polymerase sigma-70 factor (ECF subfamily)